MTIGATQEAAVYLFYPTSTIAERLISLRRLPVPKGASDTQDEVAAVERCMCGQPSRNTFLRNLARLYAHVGWTSSRCKS